MEGDKGSKKYLLLFALLFLPTIFYLIYVYGKGEQNFAHLPFITYTDVNGEVQNRKAPQFSFTDQDGNTITNKDVEGKINMRWPLLSSRVKLSSAPERTRPSRYVRRARYGFRPRLQRSPDSPDRCRLPGQRSRWQPCAKRPRRSQAQHEEALAPERHRSRSRWYDVLADLAWRRSRIPQLA